MSDHPRYPHLGEHVRVLHFVESQCPLSASHTSHTASMNKEEIRDHVWATIFEMISSCPNIVELRLVTGFGVGSGVWRVSHDLVSSFTQLIRRYLPLRDSNASSSFHLPHIQLMVHHIQLCILVSLRNRNSWCHLASKQDCLRRRLKMARIMMRTGCFPDVWNSLKQSARVVGV